MVIDKFLGKKMLFGVSRCAKKVEISLSLYQYKTVKLSRNNDKTPDIHHK